MKFCVVGAGFSGAVLARKLAEAGYHVQVYDSRHHIGGNCYTERDEVTGILIHKYGPHIFHTNKDEVWNFINQYTEMVPYIHRGKTTSNEKVYSLPINLHTINQFYGKNMSPSEAKVFIDSISESSISEPQSFEDQAHKFIGKDLYTAFMKGYTLKQWGVSPKNLPASILKRLPLRFNYDDNYFNHPFQGMPKEGYTPIFEKLLSHKKIKTTLDYFFDSDESKNYDHVFYTGPIDTWFKNKHGKLAYRTLDFVEEAYDYDFQGCAIMNYADEHIPYTRITEHKYFSPWENHTKTVIFKEYSRECKDADIPYYPIRLIKDKEALALYVKEIKKTSGVSFLGRLGTYRYLDMDVTIQESLDAAKIILEKIKNKKRIPASFVDML